MDHVPGQMPRPGTAEKTDDLLSALIPQQRDQLSGLLRILLADLTNR